MYLILKGGDDVCTLCFSRQYPHQDVIVFYWIYLNRRITVMFSQGINSKPYQPTYNENRPPSLQHYRPQTPNSYSNNHSNLQLHQPPLNRTYSKLPSYNNPPPYRNNNHNNLSRSKISLGNSQASHLSDLANEPDVFPEELIFLLRNEEKNINNVKDKIEKEKARVENDFAVFRT